MLGDHFFPFEGELALGRRRKVRPADHLHDVRRQEQRRNRDRKEMAEIEELLREPDLDEVRKLWERFFEKAVRHSRYLHAFKKDFSHILGKLFGDLKDPKDGGWLCDVGSDIKEQTILKLFSSKGTFFRALRHLKWQGGATDGVELPWSELPKPIQFLLKQRRHKELPSLYKNSKANSTIKLSYFDYYWFRFLNYSVKIHNYYWTQGNHIAGGDVHTVYQKLLQDYLDFMFPHEVSARASRHREDHPKTFLRVMVEIWLAQNSLAVPPYIPPNRYVLHYIELTLIHLMHYGNLVGKGDRVRELDIIFGPLFQFFRCAFEAPRIGKPQLFKEIACLWLVFVQPWKMSVFRKVLKSRQKRKRNLLWRIGKNEYFAPVAMDELVRKAKPGYTSNFDEFVQNNFYFYTFQFYWILNKMCTMVLRGENLEILKQVLKIYDKSTGVRKNVALQLERLKYYQYLSESLRKRLRIDPRQAQEYSIEGRDYPVNENLRILLKKMATRVGVSNPAFSCEGKRLVFMSEDSSLRERMSNLKKRMSQLLLYFLHRWRDFRTLVERFSGIQIHSGVGIENLREVFDECKSQLETSFGVRIEFDPRQKRAFEAAKGRHEAALADNRQNLRDRRVIRRNFDVRDVEEWDKPTGSYEITFLLLLLFDVQKRLGLSWNIRFLADVRTLVYVVAYLFIGYQNPPLFFTVISMIVIFFCGRNWFRAW